MKKGIRRVKAGELGLADLQTSDTVYIIGLSPFYDDVAMKTDNYRTYELGKLLRATQRKSILNILEEVGVDSTQMLKSWLNRKSPDTLYDLLKQQDGIGHTGAILCTIALMNQAPDVSRVIADNLASNIFEEDSDSAITRHRFDFISTVVTENHAKWLAKNGAEYLIKAMKLKNMPAAEKIAELALADAVKVDGDNLMSRNTYAAESELVELAKEKVNTEEAFIDDYSSANLSEEQQDSVKTLLGPNRLVLLDGGPGTGKSHVITWLVKYFGSNACLVTSYTNKACINLDERMPGYKCGGVERVQTINSLAFRCSANEKFAEAIKKNVRCLIVDESSTCSSMCIGNVLSVLRHCAPGCRLILVGDKNQLPPVCSYGMPYKRLLDASIAAKATLKEFRRSNGEGIYNAFRQFAEAGIHTIKKDDSVKIFNAKDLRQTVYIASRSYGREDADRLGCIAETNAVCSEVNDATIEYLYPDAELAPEGSTEKYLLNKPGMRVVGNTNIRDEHGQRLCAKNEMCVLLLAGANYFSYKSLIDGRIFQVPAKDAISPKNFVPGYCCTVHKFQGSEEERIIYILDNRQNLKGNAFSKQKELKYVGLSRAKKELDILAFGDYEPATQYPEELSVGVLADSQPKMYF